GSRQHKTHPTTTQEDVLKSGWSYALRVDEKRRWVTIGLECWATRERDVLEVHDPAAANVVANHQTGAGEIRAEKGESHILPTARGDTTATVIDPDDVSAMSRIQSHKGKLGLRGILIDHRRGC